MDEFGAQIKFVIWTTLLLLVLGKVLLHLKIQYLLIIIIISLSLPNLTKNVYEEFKQKEIFDQTFSNESFQNRFFGPDTAYSSLTFKKISFRDHHVDLEMNYYDDEAETEDLILIVDEFVKEYTLYSDLHYLTIHANFEGKTFMFKDIPLKKQREPFEGDDESLQAVKNSLTIQ
jgi:hypothetical protein